MLRLTGCLAVAASWRPDPAEAAITALEFALRDVPWFRALRERLIFRKSASMGMSFTLMRELFVRAGRYPVYESVGDRWRNGLSWDMGWGKTRAAQDARRFLAQDYGHPQAVPVLVYENGTWLALPKLRVGHP